jgi:hypothetical protein
MAEEVSAVPATKHRPPSALSSSGLHLGPILESRHKTTYAHTFIFPQGDIDFGEHVDRAAFEQILDMDEEDDRDFSKSIVFGFLEQAEQTFTKMETALLASPPIHPL